MARIMLRHRRLAPGIVAVVATDRRREQMPLRLVPGGIERTPNSAWAL